MKMILIYLLAFVCITNADIYQEVRDSRNFTDKVVLITGSTNGIGEQIAKLFSSLGANVVVTGRKSTDVDKAVKEVKQLSPHSLEPLGIVADLKKYEDLEHLVNKTHEVFGKIDVLVNNAGNFLSSPLMDPNFMKVFDESIEIDVRSALQLIRLTVPYLKKTKGNIINISEVWTRAPQKYRVGYGVAKQALEMSTNVLALELGGYGIRVNAISPGIIKSHEFTESLEKRISKLTPLGRVGLTIDVAKGVVFLASSDAQFITGVNIAIDGGIIYNSDSNLLSNWS